MGRNRRRRIFSIIYVPDQERDPKSISMSYTGGKILFILSVSLILYFIAGGVGFYKLYKVNKRNKVLSTENSELKIKNIKIEKIAEEFKDIRLTNEKIRRAFGQSLGLGGGTDLRLEESGNQSQVYIPGNNISLNLSEETKRGIDVQNNYYFLRKKKGGYYDPEFLPTLLPIEGFLTTHFQRGSWFVGHEHLGIDIAAEKGSVIRASGSGIVVLANWTQGFGNVVIIFHGNGLYTYYAHAMRLLVRQGEKVKRGHPIALLGSSGISSAPHLHFEIWKDGEPLNPEKYIYAIQSQKVKN